MHSRRSLSKLEPESMSLFVKRLIRIEVCHNLCNRWERHWLNFDNPNSCATSQVIRRIRSTWKAIRCQLSAWRWSAIIAFCPLKTHRSLAMCGSPLISSTSPTSFTRWVKSHFKVFFSLFFLYFFLNFSHSILHLIGGFCFFETKLLDLWSVSFVFFSFLIWEKEKFLFVEENFFILHQEKFVFNQTSIYKLYYFGFLLLAAGQKVLTFSW